MEGWIVSVSNEPKVSTGRYALWDLAVAALVIALVFFLMITMGIRSQKTAVHNRCKDRLDALGLAQQSYLVKHGEYAEELPLLRPFLDEEHRKMPFLCPIKGNRFEVFVQAERYIILAPYTPYSVNTGDTSW